MSARDQELTQAVIIGAGPAGLAVGACLERAGVPFVILEREAEVAASWRRHYERLHLHTDKVRSALPHYPFPARYPRYPSRRQVIEYLESYASHFRLEPRLQQEVIRARRPASAQVEVEATDEWETITSDRVYRSPHLVVCTGHNDEPNLPSWPGMDSFRGSLLHAREYRSGAQFEGKRVLVVGFGNSGAEVALDLAEHGARPLVSVRSPVNLIPRELLGIPVMALVIALDRLPARLADAAAAPLLHLLYGDPGKWGLARPHYGPFEQVARQRRIPLIDVGTLNRIERGEIEVRGEVERFLEDGVHFSDGSEEELDAVVLATGYRPGYERFLETEATWNRGARAAARATSAHPLTGATDRGRQRLVPGLHFCGFNVVATGMLREIAREAKQIAKHVAQTAGRCSSYH